MPAYCCHWRCHLEIFLRQQPCSADPWPLPNSPLHSLQQSVSSPFWLATRLKSSCDKLDWILPLPSLAGPADGASSRQKPQAVVCLGSQHRTKQKSPMNRTLVGPKGLQFKDCWKLRKQIQKCAFKMYLSFCVMLLKSRGRVNREEWKLYTL